MSFFDLLGNAATGGVLGLLGNALSFGMNYLKARQDHANQIELIKLQSEAKTAEAASAIAVAREQGAAAAFTASINAEAGLSGESRWVRNWRGINRPLLTNAGLLASIVFGAFGIENDMTVAVNAYTGMMVSWWFGQRAIDRSSISWGTKSISGSVASKS